jgi:hypothetical protein
MGTDVFNCPSSSGKAQIERAKDFPSRLEGNQPPQDYKTAFARDSPSCALLKVLLLDRK